MGTISTGIGLVSGINSKEIIDQLMALEARPKDLLQQRIDTTNEERLAYTDLSTRLTSIRLNGSVLNKPSTFQAATSNSTNENVITATTGIGAAVGSYNFRVANLVTAQQTMSKGFTDATTKTMDAGDLTIEVGGGEVTAENALNDLRGGSGVTRGAFRITDRSGQTAVVDISSAVTLDDVISEINTSLDISVKAEMVGDALRISDVSGQTASNLIIQDIGDGTTASELGIVASVGSDTLTGTDINYLGNDSVLANLNDGRGVRSVSGNDFKITARDGTEVDIDISTASTIEDVVELINTGGSGKVQAELVAGSNGLRLTDISGGGGALTVAAMNSSNAINDLGLTTSASGNTLDGEAVLASLGTVLLSSLKGGNGAAPGQFSIQDRAGGSASINLSNASTLQDVLDAVNNAAGISVAARVNDSGNGITLTDTSGGSGDLVVTDLFSGTLAADLGIATTGVADDTIEGGNLQRQWVSETSLLSDYNGGRGVTLGTIKITNSVGGIFNVNLDNDANLRLGDVIDSINASTTGVTARINDNGDGLVIEDDAGGLIKIEDVNSTTASDLKIEGENADGAINGSFELVLSLDGTETLEDVRTTINEQFFGVSASIVNDGTGQTPYRLSLTARNPGRAGRVVFDAGTTGLNTRTLVSAKDAAVFLGGASAEQPLLVTSSQNQLTGVISGVTINLNGASDGPVTLNISRSPDKAVDEITTLVENFNSLIERVNELTNFDTDTNERGLLLGETTIQQIETDMYSVINTVVASSGKYRIAADVGLRVGDGGVLEFDEDKFRQAFGDDPEEVKDLFTTSETGIGNVLWNKITRLIDPVDGLVTLQEQSLDDRNLQFQRRVDDLDELLAAKRLRLERQFAQMEVALADLQSQQSAIGQIQTISAPSS